MSRMAMDKKKETIRVLLDLSAEFDTLYHGILIEYLKKHLKFLGKALSWSVYYLNNCTQKVSNKDTLSAAIQVLF